MQTAFDGSRAVRRIERILGLLSGKAMTAAELAAAMHADKGGVNFYLRFLRGVTGGERRVYIESFDAERGGPRIPRYRAGSKPDAERPPRITQVQRWAKLKEDEGRYRRHQARKQAQKVVSRAKASTAPWARALGL